MTRAEILKKVNEIFWDVFDDDSIVVTEATVADDIEDWDSLTHITLITEIEDEFGFKFGMKDVLGMKNVGEMLDIIEKNQK
jgi:acyl carrier protein